ncbi:MAG TPA: GNAT family N-acetyltransferase [Lacipirellula sp.]
MKESSVSELRVRGATPADVPTLLEFIRELAEYERLADMVVITEELLAQALFGERPAAEALIAELDGEAVGWALFFTNFSTFKGLPGFYIEDIYVRPQFRGRGAGKALLKRVAEMAVERDYGRVEWAVLDWNTPSIEFYKSLGATPLEEWTMYRLTGESLERLGSV